MANLTNGTSKWTGSINLNKPSSTLTLSTSEQYIAKDIEIGLNVVASSEFGDATAANVRSGKTFTSSAGVNIAGTMPNAISAAGSTSATLVYGKENLLVNPQDLTKWSKEAGVTVTADTDGFYKVTIAASNNTSAWGIYQDYNLTANTDYTVVVTGKGNRGAVLRVGLGTGGTWGSIVYSFSTTASTGSYTFNSGSNTVLRFYLCINGHLADTEECVYFKNPFLIKNTNTSSIASSTEYSIPVITTSTGNSKITTAGWIDTGTLETAVGKTVNYINIPVVTPSFAGGSVTATSAYASGQSANVEVEDTDHSGVKVGFTANASRTAVTYTNSAGAITAHSGTTASAAANATAANASKWIKGFTLNKDKYIEMTNSVTEKVTLKYNGNTNSVDFIFA